jgi:[protein-PII] uridylyltransferase
MQDRQAHLFQTEQDAYPLPAVPEPGSSLATWKEYVKTAQAVVYEAQRNKAKGWYVARKQSDFSDALVEGLLRHVEAEYFRKYPRVDTRLAFIAQGGYGRREMSPRSDIDILFVFPSRPTPYVEFITEKVLYTLWDLGFHVGHATRNFRDTVKFGLQDSTVRTALLDHRFIAGDREVFEEFATILKNEVLYVNSNKFIKEKLREAEERHARFGNSTNVVEPHVKEGEGGMRDLHTALWVAKVKYRVEDFHGLFQKGVIPRSDVDALERAWDFLLRVRHELHIRTNKKHDIINFELTAPIAEALGFKNRAASLAAENFMQRYYYHARMVLHLTRGIIERCQESTEGRLRGTFGRLGIKELGHGFRSYRSELIIGEKALAEEPANIMRAFNLKQKHKIPFSRSTYELLRRHARKINHEFRINPEVNGLFVDMVGGISNVSDILLEMNESRILGQYMPEWGKLFCRAQYQLYHRYTVDVHSCFCVREVERLMLDDQTTPELFRGVVAKLPDKPLMLLSAMLHDIGKGRGKDHSIVGSQLVKRIGKRMGLSPRRIDRLALLVRHHLTMNAVAQRRDLHDPATINEFANHVGDIENLDMLYVLSYADTRAVGPNVWNEWKSSLLTELYERTRWVLETGDFKGKWLKSEVKSRKQAVVQQAAAGEVMPGEQIDEFLAALPDRYFLNNQPDEIFRHLQLSSKLEDRPFVMGRREREPGVFEIVFIGYDRPGLFSILSGSLRACDLNILDAQINTTHTGRVLDVYRVTPVDSLEMSDARWARLLEVIQGTLDGTVDLDKVVREKARPSLLRAEKPAAVKVKKAKIEVDNELSQHFTIVDIFAYDRFGLLYDLTKAIAELGLTIHLAKISTAADLIADVFYLQRVSGGKIADPAELDTLRQRVLAIIEEPQTA